MKLLYRIKCLWVGHDYSNTGDGWLCRKCHAHLTLDDVLRQPLRYLMREWWQRQKDWWHCSECGGRFGKHDDSVAHLPF